MASEVRPLREKSGIRKFYGTKQPMILKGRGKNKYAIKDNFPDFCKKNQIYEYASVVRGELSLQRNLSKMSLKTFFFCGPDMRYDSFAESIGPIQWFP
ncbi:hypothetical protein DENIS_2027 [Desulfonema ishimotonii]|uniref:Uncharacterized protein n=1 Tax=Desulfonema ishimotonii TaxID=45657 RepID=A0A401FVR2_9BACT|nr:hypothetical protein [Desulfonema ishimotonii]GBC61067.1 hypothetical protein DENIS_2027 [Desulfonema ishimotonii]